MKKKSFKATVIAVVLLLFSRLPRKRRKTPLRLVVFYRDAEYSCYLESLKMKRLSSNVLSFVVSIAALTVAGLTASVDGVTLLTSSDPNVLAVTPLDGGLYKVDVVGKGNASLFVSADADLGDGVRNIGQEFPFEIYDADSEADHFDLSIADVQLKPVEAAVDTTDSGADSAAATGDSATGSGETSV